MGVRDRLSAGLARQLGHPSGLHGKVVARGLNKGNGTVVREAVAASGAAPGQTVADLGFGGGVGLRLLPDEVGSTGIVQGVEISQTMLATARRRFAADLVSGRLVLSPGDLTALPLPDGSLDSVVTTNTAYFVEDPARAFSEIARVLRPGGRVVVGIGDPDHMRTFPFTAHGFRLRPVDDVVELLTGAGFRGRDRPSRRRRQDRVPSPRGGSRVTAEAMSARVAASFAAQGLMAHIGARLGRVSPGEVHIHLPMGPHVTQQHGYFHGGVTTTIADSAGGYAALTLLPDESEVLAVELKINPGCAGDRGGARRDRHRAQVGAHPDGLPDGRLRRHGHPAQARRRGAADQHRRTPLSGSEPGRWWCVRC
ncbi:methyltransferase domain-containing protein [Nocardioides sp. B-3]|uniref:methyltransferase domain-containing protein n=1 Tax=Nocardioides sp. B-3 TaxID=2895565 RepID=UPI002152693F|nr:methyltransferase domain-containing protein [Nocardioides sp. B-3]UUZ58658.1 methyltransferase domain-containing protein [Nocardioides sp. B-3]